MTGPAPLSDRIVIAVARLVDDAQKERRDPSHADLEFEINRAHLREADPNQQGNVLGKAKRVRQVLSWAIEGDPARGERLVATLIAHLQGCGGFRPESPNYVGQQEIEDARCAFRAEGFDLGLDGDLRPLVLEGLSGVELTQALEAYVRRAKRGIQDAALLTGTSKDLLEATAAHVVHEKWGSHPSTVNFPTLLGQAFSALGFATSHDTPELGEPAQKRVERAMFEFACAINGLRNKEGTGHGRPWLPTVTKAESRAAVEAMGVVAERMLAALAQLR